MALSQQVLWNIEIKILSVFAEANTGLSLHCQLYFWQMSLSDKYVCIYTLGVCVSCNFGVYLKVTCEVSVRNVMPLVVL